MEVSIEAIGAFCAGVAVVVTYTTMIRRYTNLERDVIDLKRWREQIDPAAERHKRRDSDVIKFVRRDPQPPSQGA